MADGKQVHSARRAAGAIATAFLAVGFGQSTAADDKHHDGWQPSHGRAPFQFALIGDTRYNAEGDAQFGPMRAEINAQRQLQWVVHVGDILGGTPCSDELHTERLAQFQAFRMPFVYTPGDNEWADCHYSSLGSFYPLERLSAVRRIFFPQPGKTLGSRPMPVYTQADDPIYRDYVENVMWVRGGVVFVTVHMVGSNNDLTPWARDLGAGVYDPTDTVATPRADRIAEVAARVAADLAWIDKAFELADAIKSPGVFVISHANPRFENTVNEPYAAWVAAIQKHAVTFGKPVILAHGDTHTPRVDKPLTAPTLPVVPAAPNPARVENFTRVETFGFPDTHWIRVTVSPMDPEVFRFELMTVDANRRKFAPIP
jgi:hypothetical protein